MIIVEPSVMLDSVTTVRPVTLINMIARTCYMSELPGMAEQRKFVKKLIANGHESPLEFVDFIFSLRVDRGISHELVRHRLASYQQESTRYVRYDNISVIRPSEIQAGSPADVAWYEACIAAEEAYKKLLVHTRPEIARSVLPNCLATNMRMKMNLRELRHFLKLRLDKRAHPDMRNLAQQIANLIVNTVTDGSVLIGDIYDTRGKSEGAGEKAPERK